MSVTIFTTYQTYNNYHFNNPPKNPASAYRIMYTTVNTLQVQHPTQREDTLPWLPGTP